MTIEVLRRIYEVLEIIPKKHSEYDLFVCKAPAGYRECFQRFGIECGQSRVVARPRFNIKF